MNQWELSNLERLKSLGLISSDMIEKIDKSFEENKKSIIDSSIRLLVRCYFDLYKADLEKIKIKIREDGDLYKGLKVLEIINDEYQKQNNPQKIRMKYAKDTQERFYKTIFQMESDRAKKCREHKQNE